MAPRPLALPLLLCALLATACGNGPDAPPDAGAGGPEGVREHPASPAPAGTGSREARDVNGDGYPDLVFAAHRSTDDATGEADHVVVVYGSARGLDPSARTLLETGPTVALPSSGGVTADLDGDGFADIPFALRGDAVAGGIEHAVYWGGPDGPGTDAVPLALPREEGRSATWPPAAAGDFDGDGAADLALVLGSQASVSDDAVTVLYGPFARDGAAARTASRPFPSWIDSLVAGPPGPDGSPLLVHHSSDGEQHRNTLFLTGPGDPAGWAQADPVGGSMAAFGDVDGDGTADLVVGDDGNRNNEPGYETEAPEVHHRLNLYPGPLAAGLGEPVAVDLPGEETASTWGTRVLALCDTDGDGVREAAVGRRGHGVDTVRWADGALEVVDAPPLVRRGPEDGPLGGGSAQERTAVLSGCADHDADGSDELLLSYSRGNAGASPDRWWVTDGTEDLLGFDSAGFGD
ncbi:Repeat domain-containing protein [Nocardiopsis flavescens]|uniref:Repeat domain-containing protein n=1 Tax=Nocardiopsis flavescens TaxID=758803 RepID=A0A1M6J9V4_9ACTN|nr:FG-GAP-like repeat-containing protein [Nocardiopsis flavescens]SHJ43508.1 Repeat domain-containing protein [Nocardiopsis flavescens]